MHVLCFMLGIYFIIGNLHHTFFSKTIDCLPNQFYTVYGNHDLPQHSMENAHKSGINTVQTAGKLTVLRNGHWGDDAPANSIYELLNTEEFQDVAIWHKFTYTGDKPWPTCAETPATKLLMQFPKYKLILTGDNHTPFVVKYRNRVLVNPGSLTRQTADQATHTPRVYIWDAEKNIVKPVLLPIQVEAITRQHLEIKEERDNRMEAFISRLQEDWDISISFEDNLKVFFSINKLRKSVIALIYKAMDTTV